MKQRTDKPRIPLPLLLLAGLFALVGATLVTYRPDRPVAALVPGTSAGPAFEVQVIRPRAGLPLGGLLPPRFFGLDADLRFDSSSPGASMDRAGPTRLECTADGWRLLLVWDGTGRVTRSTEVVFEIVFEDELRSVRCRPSDAREHLVTTAALPGDELAGAFDLELTPCEDARTGEALGWPAQPLRLRGSFDRVPAR